jgi:hypothetical protein
MLLSLESAFVLNGVQILLDKLRWVNIIIGM